MQIFIKTDKACSLQLEEYATAGNVKHRVAALQGIPVDKQRLVFGSKQLSDDISLRAAGVTDNSTLYVLLRLLGGAKKRKKKTYTKPKKQKHKHKKVKLAVLKYYKVADSGKVERLRKVCPSETCGAGIFMATHGNRVYCGKCAKTYTYDKQ